MANEKGFTPTEYTTFKSPLSPEKAAENPPINAIETLQSIKKQYQEQTLKRYEVGSAIGKTFVQEVARIHASTMSLSEKAKAIKKIQKFYSEVIPDEGQSSINGFLAEFAIGHTINNEVGFSVYYPTEQEDHKAKIDWWVDLDNGTQLAVQTKCIMVDETPPQIHFRLDDQEDVTRLVSFLNRQTTDYSRIHEHLGDMEEYAKERGVVAVLALLPSPTGDFARFNSETGLPFNNPKYENSLADDLYNEIDEKFLQDE